MKQGYHHLQSVLPNKGAAADTSTMRAGLSQLKPSPLGGRNQDSHAYDQEA